MAAPQLTPLSTDDGAGVFIVEMYRNHSGVVKLALILVRTWVYDRTAKRRVQKYTVPGGERDSGEDIEDTARRECKEETANLIRLPKHMMDGRFAVRHRNFVVYFVMLKGPIMSVHYYYNLTVLAANGADHDYLETDVITRVYIDQLVMDDVLRAQGDLQTTDANDNPITIEARTKAVIREALNADFIDQLTPVKPKLCDDFKHPAHPTLRGTKCYYL